MIDIISIIDITPLFNLLKRALDVFWYLNLLSVILFAALLAWSIVGDPASLAPGVLKISLGGVNVEPEADGPGVAVMLPVALRQLGPGGDLQNIRAEARFPVEKGWFFSLTLALMLGAFAMLLLVIGEMRQVAESVTRGRPFSRENVTHVRRIGLGIIILELGHAGAILFWSHAAGDIVGAGFVPSNHVGAPEVLYGLVVLALAEIFREGARLQEEQSLTV